MEAQDLQKLRKDLDRLFPLPSSEWERASQSLRVKEASKGELIIRAGDRVDELAYLESGLVRKFYLGPEGREHIKGFALEGDLFAPYASLLVSKPASFSVEALEPCRYIVFPAQEFRELYTREPLWQRLALRIAESLFLEREHREFQLLTLTAEERYRAFREELPELHRRVPQYHIAAYLGITPVALSRIRARKR